ncbi:hypothetical protein FRX31_018200 [Thalictrum thalictroides]|uniref:Secreted protein n=1 Tax=Thalictrum thalictroides TaxID=46969 RepID=A0A7J6W577_THATH|nr:hypothetical protein FRX31_018200 [Thalictrum thalictroides]
MSDASSGCGGRGLLLLLPLMAATDSCELAISSLRVGWHHADERSQGLDRWPTINLALKVVHSLGHTPSHEFEVIRS